MSEHPVLSLIVAAAENRVIGKDGDMPWRLSTDLKRFKALTKGHPVIMGRKTWESLPKRPLPARPNIVVSRNSDYHAEGAWLASNVTIAVNLARSMAIKAGLTEIFVIGGAGLYTAALPLADRVHLTEVCAQPDGDTYFPELSSDDWQEASNEPVPAGEKDDYPTVYRVLNRRKI